jgi:hypothetical protein
MVRTDWGSDLKFDAKSDRTLGHQRGAHKQHQRKSNLRHNEGVAQARTGTVAPTRWPARSISESHRPTPGSWNQPGDDSGQASNCQV